MLIQEVQELKNKEVEDQEREIKLLFVQVLLNAFINYLSKTSANLFNIIEKKTEHRQKIRKRSVLMVNETLFCPEILDSCSKLLFFFKEQYPFSTRPA